MKVLFMLLLSLGAFANSAEEFVEDTGIEIIAELHDLELAEGVLTDGMRRVIAEKRIKRIIKKRVSKRNRKLTERVQELMLEGPGSDKVEDILTKIFGPRVAQILMKVSGLPEVEKRLTDLVIAWPMLFDPVTCAEGFKKIVPALAYVAAVAAVYMYAPGFAYLALTAGTVAAGTMEIVIDTTKADDRVCGLVHRKEYYEESFAY